MDVHSTLKGLGFTERQALAYTSLLTLGEATMSEFARKAGLKRPTAYLVIEELNLLGLVSTKRKGRRRYISAAHPHRLREITQFRLNRVEELFPELVALYNTPKEKPKIQVYEGLEGIKLLYRELFYRLRQGDEALWFARIGTLRDYFPDCLREYKKLLRELHNPHIRELNYGDHEGRVWAQELKRLRGRNHLIRALPIAFEFGQSDNVIIGDWLAIFSLRRESMFVVIIQSSEVVKTYRALFEWAWKQGKEV